ncbi:MAG: sugar phosphate nucleotidyltransferase [bacterium]
MPVKRDLCREFGILQVDESGKIIRFVEKPKEEKLLEDLKVPPQLFDDRGIVSKKREHIASMGIYVFNTDLLFDALGTNHGSDFGKDIIPSLIGQKTIQAHFFDGYWEDIGTVGSFWECNLTLTDPVPPFDFFDSENPVYTHALYLPTAKLNSSRANRVLMASGCIVDDSDITRSVLGTRSVVRRGTRFENVVMMGADHFERSEDAAENARLGRPDVGVGEDCTIRNAIIDKNARIGKGCRLAPTGLPEKWETEALFVRDGVIVVKKGATVPAGTIVGE